MKKEEKENLEDLKGEAYSALELLDSVTDSRVLENYRDIDDSLYRTKQELKNLMGKIDYAIKHSVMDGEEE